MQTSGSVLNWLNILGTSHMENVMLSTNVLSEQFQSLLLHHSLSLNMAKNIIIASYLNDNIFFTNHKTLFIQQTFQRTFLQPSLAYIYVFFNYIYICFHFVLWVKM